MFRLLLISGFAFLLALAPLSSSATNRLALVFGIDKYDHLPDLVNAGRDAQAVSDQLSELGFEVILRLNANNRQIFRSLREFENRLANNNGTGLVFFAGHGIQADGRNYLLPADALVEIEDDLEPEAIDAGRILESMARAGNPLNILVLDACRDNPLPKRTRSAARGLAVTSIPSGAKGTAILYAAGEGQVAQDGPPGGHGVFTNALLESLAVPNLSLEQVIKHLTRSVLQRTNGRQRPWSLASIQGDFYFNPKKVIDSAKTETPPAPTVNQIDVAHQIWMAIKDSENLEMLKSFQNRFSDTPYAMAAEARVTMLTADNKPTEAAEARIAMLTLEDAPAKAVEPKPEKPAIKAVNRIAGIQIFGPHEMVAIEGNCYLMGSGNNEAGRQSNEYPHQVCVSSFLMDRYEVTYDAYDAFAKATGSELPDDEGMGRGRRPVISIEYEDALAYANWASEQYGIQLRLPTEAEWEYACRSGGKQEAYCGGDDPTQVAVFNTDKTEEVGSKTPNGLGLYDMSGNAFEMTCSSYSEEGIVGRQSYDGAELKCSKSWLEPLIAVDISNSFRGGKWDSPIKEIRSRARGYYTVGTQNFGQYIKAMGFRLVATEPGTPGSIGVASSEKCTVWDDPDYAAFMSQFKNASELRARQNQNCKP